MKGTTSPPLIGLSLVISMGLAAIAIPFWEGVGVLASGFWIFNTDEVRPGTNFEHLSMSSNI